MAAVEKVDGPTHYGGKDNPYEAIKVIEAHNLNFNLGSVVKYVLRAGKKPGEPADDDLEKAAWYCLREAERRRKVVAASTPRALKCDANCPNESPNSHPVHT